MNNTAHNLHTSTTIRLTHQEEGWLDEFAREALPSLVGAYPQGTNDPEAWVAHRCYQYALAMIAERRAILREHRR